jgi:hypothetical protein
MFLGHVLIIVGVIMWLKLFGSKLYSLPSLNNYSAVLGNCVQDATP